MAAGLLTKLIDKTVTTDVLIKWLAHDDDESLISDELSIAPVNKSEFVPFFLNYLRLQASSLLRDTKPSSISPQKTPISSNKHYKPNGHFSCTPGPRSNVETPSSTHRFQRFDSRTRENSSSSNVSFESPPQKWGARSSNTSGSLSETSLTNSTSGRKGNQRQRPQRSLGDFLSPANGGKADGGVRKDDCSPSLGGRWSNNRGRGGASSGERLAWRRQSPRNEEVNDPLPVFSLANADDFPTVTKSKEVPRQSITTKSRRIVPTQVCSVGQSDDPSASFLKAVDVPAPAKVMPRSIWAKPPDTMSGNPELDVLMKRSRALHISKVKSSEVASTDFLGADVTLESKSDLQAVASNDRCDVLRIWNPVVVVDVVQGSPEKVTYSEELEVLAVFYSQCIQEGLVSNVTMELYFIVQLLTVRSPQVLATTLEDSEGFDSETSYLSTVHNAVFFATSSLLHLHSFLSLLDRSTIRPMAENLRVSLFSPKLKDLLLGLCDQPLAQSHHAVSYSSPLGGVIFQPETDNRSNFPTDRSFHTFKKQRDAFYELLRQWEEKHLCVGWTMKETQQTTIRWLMDGCLPDLSNYFHLVRLFVLQLIKPCRSSVMSYCTVDQRHLPNGRLSWYFFTLLQLGEDCADFMCSAEGSSQEEEKDGKLRQELKEANPDKLKRLQERLVNPVSAGGICPAPSFPGCQEFFRDFITIAGNHVFNQHLSDTLRSKINKLMRKSETSGHVELTDTTSAQEKHEELLHSLLMLRILGKFLGSLTFLPYRSNELPQESVKLSAIKIRNEVQQPVDVLACLTSSVGQREKTLLCVVWVVDFLSQMDFVAPELNYYQEVFGRLVDIYWSCCRMLTSQRSYAFFLMTALLGWLFELKCFPEVLFYRQKSRMILWSETESHSLDVFLLIDARILYACCPMLGELRSLLVDFSAECHSSSGNVRKITPVKTMAPVSQQLRSRSKKDVQQRLLDGFFDMHPDSLRQTINFVADRIASNFVKFFQANNLCQRLERLQSMAKEEAHRLFSTSTTTEDGESEAESLQRLKEFAVDALENILKDGKTESRRYCLEKVDSVMAGLLSEDTTSAVKSLASRISLSRVLLKVDAWLIEKLTLDFFFKDLRVVFNHELRRLSSEPVDCVLVPLKQVEHRSSAPAPSDVLSDLKQFLSDLLLTKGDSLNSDRLLFVVTSVESVVNYRQDLLPPVLTHIATLSISLACYTIFYRPDLWTGDIEERLIKIWEMLECRPLFERITCVKHIQCFMKSSEESRKKFVDFLRILTDKSLVTTETFDDFNRTL